VCVCVCGGGVHLFGTRLLLQRLMA